MTKSDDDQDYLFSEDEMDDPAEALLERTNAVVHIPMSNMADAARQEEPVAPVDEHPRCHIGHLLMIYMGIISIVGLIVVMIYRGTTVGF
jgi:hypothetical protein